MVFALGAIFLLVALFGRFFNMPTNERGTVAVLGVLVAALALGVKALYEFASRRRAESCHQEIGELVKQAGRCREEIGRLDKQLPASADTLQERLMQAEEDLDQLSDLQPLETQRQTAQQRLEHVQNEKTTLNSQLKDARNRWRDALRAGGLPEAITPTQFRQLSQPDSKASELRQRLLEHHERSREKQAELRDVQQKVQALLDRAGLHEKSDRLVDQVAQLHQSLQQARQHRQEHETLHRQWRDGAREQDRIARDAKRNTTRRQELIAQYGVSSARELKAIAERRQEYLDLSRERDGILRHLAEQLGKCCTLADLRHDLSKGGFEARLATWEQEHDQAAATLAELHERRGELNHQLKMLVGRREQASRRLEASETAAQFQRRARQWLTLAGISLSLDSVRKSYESDRQPETLAEASTYLTSLTQGKYNRIWTPFGEAALCVDDLQGRAVRVEHLSRGTREQVFLSLRLALAASYSRRGAGLPLILDDVFVNFDARRALAAAETICRFAAAGHQVLVFTCHEHIRDVFHKLGVDLRVLPDAARNADDPQPVLPWALAPAPEPVAAPVAVPAPAVAAPVADYDPELEHELMYGSLADEPGMDVEPLPAEPAKPRRKATRRKRAAEPVEPRVELLMEPAPLEVPFVEHVEELDREPIFASDWEDPYLLVNPVEYESASETGAGRLW
jgi:DNA repair exonuclease SbcCD ATPase subunit